MESTTFAFSSFGSSFTILKPVLSSFPASMMSLPPILPIIFPILILMEPFGTREIPLSLMIFNLSGFLKYTLTLATGALIKTTFILFFQRLHNRLLFQSFLLSVRRVLLRFVLGLRQK